MTLLNLSKYEENKQRIMASNAVQGILHVLKNGNMEARKNAANNFYSLSAVDENKGVIGSSGAIEALVTLFCVGSKSGKIEAAKALFKLRLYQGNTERAIKSGIVPKLIEMLTEPGGEMQDEALVIMLLIVRHRNGNAEIGPMNDISTLVELISNGSSVNKENATDVLVYLCRGDPVHVPIVASLGVINPLLELAENGSEWGKRKAEQLLKLLST